MSIQAIVNEVKDRVEPYVAKGQEVVSVSFDTFKKAGDVVAEGVQTVVKTQFGAGQDLVAAVQTSFEKARSAGLKAVVTDPIEYLPDGRKTVISAYNDTFSTVSKSSGEIVKIVKDGFDGVTAQFGKSPTAKKVASAKKTIRKTAKRASKKVEKAVA